MPKRASHAKAEEGVRRAADGAEMPQKKFFRQRAHINPLSFASSFDYPISPERMDWSPYFPAYAAEPGAAGAYAGLRDGRRVEVADVGCGFGGLLVGLSPVLPDSLCLGMEIRSKVTEYVRLRILALRNGVKDEDDASAPAAAGGSATPSAAAAAEPGASAAPASSSSSSSLTSPPLPAAPLPACAPRPFDNISVLKTNAMKYLTSFFARGQLTKLFFCFPDPHFKRSNHRRRIVSTPLLADYAYVLRPGGRLYTITDVRDLHNWMAAHGDAHPAFARVPADQLEADPCVAVMRSYTEEGKKVERAAGSKHVAVFTRLTDEEAAAKAGALTPGGFWTKPAVHYTYEPAPSQAAHQKLQGARKSRRDGERAATSGGGGSSSGSGDHGRGDGGVAAEAEPVAQPQGGQAEEDSSEE